MLKVGLTGGIGSGKSYVAKMFEAKGIPVYYADKEAKRLMIQDKKLKASVKDLLGKQAYHRNGRLNRPYVASQIFGDKSLLSQINGLVHPAVKADFVSWAGRQEAPYVLEESAIIFENKLYKNFDIVLLVTADKDLRLQRVMKRDKVTAAQVQARMNQQFPEKKKIALTKFVIYNNEDGTLAEQVSDMHQQILALTK